jgi:hypothetical protein
MAFLAQFFRKRAIRKYIVRLSPELVKGFGPQDEFTVPQIERMIEKCRLSPKYLAYAVAIFRTTAPEVVVSGRRIDQGTLDSMRSEISQWFFEGYPYRTKEVIELSRPVSWQGGANTDRDSNRLGMNSRD